MGRSLSPLAGKLLRELEEAGAEHVATLLAVANTDISTFRGTVDELLSRRFVEWGRYEIRDGVGTYVSASAPDWDAFVGAANEFDDTGPLLMLTEAGTNALEL